MELEDLVNSKIKELKDLGIKVDCYSWKRKDRPSGLATIDCDYAIDIYLGEDSVDVGQMSNEKVSYDDKLTRLKFKK